MEENNCFIIDSQTDWETAENMENIQIINERIYLENLDTYAYSDTLDTGTQEVRSIALDTCGILFMSSTTKNLFIKRFLDLPKFFISDCNSFLEPASIAVSDNDLYVVDRENNEEGNANGWVLYCLARINYQIRRKQTIDEGTEIAAKGTDGLYLLDTAGKKVFNVEYYWQWEPQEIIPLDSNGMPYPLDQPIDIASDREGFFYILEADKKEILKFNPTGQWERTIPIPFETGSRFTALAAASSNNLYLGVVNEDDSNGVLQLGKSSIHENNGSYISAPFDSTIPQCRWHRVLLDADIPANTLIKLSYCASQEEGTYDFNGITTLENPKDALLIEATGRYIRFKIELLADETGQNSPQIRSLKVYYPRDTYLRYLPGTYQEDDAGKDFLERFLSLFETFMQHSETQIYNFTEYLDSHTVPGPFIPWLSQWLAAAVDENWSDAQQRQLLQEAPQLYKKRGTGAVLARIIEIFYGTAPIIIENFQMDCIDSDEHRSMMEDLFSTDPYLFSVLLPPKWEDPDSEVKSAIIVSDTQRAALQRIIDAEKPAYTTAALHLLEPAVYLDMHTYLGINSLLSKNDFLLEKTSVLGRDTITYDSEDCAQVERNSRIGIEFKLT
jgi:phage tail-like protein